MRTAQLGGGKKKMVQAPLEPFKKGEFRRELEKVFGSDYGIEFTNKGLDETVMNFDNLLRAFL